MAAKAKLLLIDDDQTLIKALEIYLSRANYEVHSAYNGAEGLRKLYELKPDLVVLDVMMPQLDGWETCRRIRDMSTVPIIMLTSKVQETDRIKGLRMGADDYVPKPFSLKELEARIDAVLRRTKEESGVPRRKPIYVSDDLVIDAERWEARRKGERLELTGTELRLLIYLAENAGRVLSHQQILQEIWGPEYVDNTDYTKLFIWRLRRKIEEDPSNPKYILTERGIGYRMATPRET
ncbi:MAG: response regulator transcription factor [Chloroflexi bacterium]|nr:response regulator transcription factor [Chloroflexota bacterium]